MAVMCGWEVEKMGPRMAPQILLNKTGCRKDHSLREETQEEGRRTGTGREDLKIRFGQVAFKMPHGIYGSEIHR